MTNLRLARPQEVFGDREILRALRAFQRGDFSVRMPSHLTGVDGEIAETFNDVVRMTEALAGEFARLRDQVGKEGRINQRASVPAASGAWLACLVSVNTLIGDLVRPIFEAAAVIDAVAKGDLSKKMTMDATGEFLELKNTINTMVDQLNAFASEVSRVTREVDIDGRLGGQAQVPGAAGIWKGLTDDVNLMVANLTSRVRGIASIVTAVANGNLDHKVMFEAKGEIAALADAMNGMIDTLATFADQVTKVARAVGVEGKLGGQAKVLGATGLWRVLTDNVNQLAARLTIQVRAIAEVATAVAQGDLTRSIVVDAQGEIAALKDKINEMIRNLADTTRKNTEQDWRKTHLANFSRTLQGHRNLVAVSKLVLTELIPLVNAQRGVIYARNVDNDKPGFVALATYSSEPDNNAPGEPHVQENLIEQCAFERKRILLNDGTVDSMRLHPEPGAHAAASVIIMPVRFEGEVNAVIELASCKRFSEAHLSFLEQLTESIGVVFNTIDANMRTERLLAKSQSLAKELQGQQEELQRSNRRLRQNARQLSEQMKQVKYKNSEIELARAALEEKAEQLALNSRYKTEFLANMSHELRTPLNSLLILAQLLAENPASNLTPRQIEFARTIYAAGNDLLALINDVLDLAKVESGTVTLHIANERFAELRDYLNGAFRQLANDKGLQFRISIEPDLPPAMRTDAKRLWQILKNLLSNAFKFTAEGTVTLEVAMAGAGWTPQHPVLAAAAKVVAFSVIDTGIGIAPEKQQIIFDAFQQADGTTSRNFGGTGLGLSISARLAHLLGGEIKVQSRPGKGSTFTLYLPLVQNAEGDNARLENFVGVPAADLLGVSVERAGRPAQVPVPGQGAFAQPAPEEATPYLQDAARNVQSLIRPALTGSAKVMTELAGRKVLLVDDDIRNIFALSSALEEQGMIVMNAENGLDAITVLRNHPQIDIILIDMMMPEMDGYDTIRAMRGFEHFTGVPIIGVSARAMKGDREKCIAAGASDYIAKPVNVDHLLSLIRARLVK